MNILEHRLPPPVVALLIALAMIAVAWFRPPGAVDPAIRYGLAGVLVAVAVAFGVPAVFIGLVPILTERGMSTAATAVALGLGSTSTTVLRPGRSAVRRSTAECMAKRNPLTFGYRQALTR